MDPNSMSSKVIQPNKLSPCNEDDFREIKKEMFEPEPQDYENFHEKVFSNLSHNFDNETNIVEIDEAFKKLEECFIENNILTKNGLSKYNPKCPFDARDFLKYRDIDDAFVDMVISDVNVNVRNNDFSPKKTNFKYFKDSIFSVEVTDPAVSDNEDSQSKVEESDSEGIGEYESHIDSQSENDGSDYETSTVDEVNDRVVDDISMDGVTNLNSSSLDRKQTKSLPHAESDFDSGINSFDKLDTDLKETVRDVRVMVEKLPDDFSDHSFNTEDDNISLLETESSTLSNVPQTGSRQVARKKTGGVPLNNTVNQDSNKDQQPSQQLNNKDADFVPSVFDKMTRAGKRDLERVLAESTANLVIQKTTQLISEKIKELQTKDNDSDDSSSEDEAEESDIHKTAELVTNTIIEFLTKSKSKKLDKLGKDISEEIANKVSNLKLNETIPNKEEEPVSVQTQLSPVKPNCTSPAEVEPEKIVENKIIKSNEKTEENNKENSNIKRVTRESSRMNAQKKKPVRKSSIGNNTRKTLAEQFEEIARVERDIINCELTTPLNEEEEELKPPSSSPAEPRRPETRQSKQKQKGSAKNIPETNLPSKNEVKRTSQSKRRSSTRKKNSAEKNKSVSSNVESMNDDSLIDGQFLIDADMNDDSVLSVSDLDLSKLSNNVENTSSTDYTILKASADSTTADIGVDNKETSTKEVNKDSRLSEVGSQDDNVKSVTENNATTESDKVSKKYASWDTKVSAEDSAHSIEIQDLEKNKVKSNISESEKKPLEEQRDDSKIDKTRKLSVQSVSELTTEPCRKSARIRKMKEAAIKTNPPEPSVPSSVPFQVLNDLITDIEESLQKEKTETKEVKEISPEVPKVGINQDHTKLLATGKDFLNESTYENVEISADSTSFLNYSIDDSFKLMIDESFLITPTDEANEHMNEDLSGSISPITQKKGSNDELKLPSASTKEEIDDTTSSNSSKKEDSDELKSPSAAMKKELGESTSSIILNKEDNDELKSPHVAKTEEIDECTSSISKKIEIDESTSSSIVKKEEIDESSPPIISKKVEIDESTSSSISKKVDIDERRALCTLKKEEDIVESILLTTLKNKEINEVVPLSTLKQKDTDERVVKSSLEERKEVKGGNLRKEEKAVNNKKVEKSIEKIGSVKLEEGDQLEEGVKGGGKNEKKIISQLSIENIQTSVPKPLTNEEKIAQLTKRDPRLVNDKKIVSVLMRDPRIRNKLPKIEEKPAQPITSENNPPLPATSEKKLPPLPTAPEKELPPLPTSPEKKPPPLPTSPEKKLPPLPTSPLKRPPLPTTPEESAIPIALKLATLPTTPEKTEPEDMELESPNSPNAIRPTIPSKNNNPMLGAQQFNEEKKFDSVPNSKSDFVEQNDSTRKKKARKEVDAELLYKTPLSDLHVSSGDRPTYERTIKKKRSGPPLSKKDRDLNEEARAKEQRRNWPQEEFNEERNFSRPPEGQIPEGYYRRDSYDDRNYMPPEGIRRSDGHPYGQGSGERSEGHPYGQGSGEMYENGRRNFHPQERDHDFPSRSRDSFEEESYARRMLTEEYPSAHERNDFDDNHIYSRREFFRRNKFAHDHDHFSNSRFQEPSSSRQENSFYAQKSTFAVPADSVFRVSAYPPVSLLPDPMYNREEEFDQSYGNMDTDSFSPPSSDLCPPPPLIRSPTPERLRPDNYCPSPPRIGGRNSPDDRDYEEFNRPFHRNYERDERSFRGGRNHFHREGRPHQRGGNYKRRGNGRDYHHRWEDSPPRKRFASDHIRGGLMNDDIVGGPSGRGGEGDAGRWRRSPSWSPDRRRWSRERSLSPPREPHPWDSPRTPSPPRWHENYRERPYKNYHRY